MKDEKILQAIAPCSLCCYTCPAMNGGIIEKTAEKLHHYFEGYYDFQKENLPDKWKEYAEAFKQFDNELVRYTNPRCKGCRANEHKGCCIDGCFILNCTMKHSVDFCGDCKEFPCNKIITDIFSPTVIGEWVNGNERIRAVGIEKYYEEVTSRSHYLPFKKD